MQKKRQEKRMFWADGLRVISILMVVMIHTSAQVLYEWGSVSHFSWNVANMLNSFSRICVPLFVMLSGALLLQKKETTQDFLSKRIPRILIPWAIWGSVTLLYIFDFSITELLALEFAALKITIIQTYIGGFWFMPMIFGLYLITPLIKPFVHKARTADFYYFFALWFLCASFVPKWAAYSGYFIAGYYLTSKVTIPKKIQKQSLVLYIMTSLVIALGTYQQTVFSNHFYEGFYEYLHLLVAISSVAGFVGLRWLFEIFDKATKSLKKIKGVREKIQVISNASFGIFLSHQLIIDALATGKFGVLIHSLMVTPILGLIVTFSLVFMSSTVLVVLLERVGKRLFSTM